MDRYVLGDVLDEAVSQFGDKEAIIYGHERVTYAQLGERVNNLAKAFLKLGINKGDKVTVWMPDCPEWVYAYFAIAKVGGTYVALNARHRTKDAQYIINHSDTVLLVTSDKIPEIVDYAGMVYQMSPQISEASDYRLSVPEFPTLRYVVAVTTRYHPGIMRFHDVMEIGKQVPDEELSERQSKVQPNDLATLQYTSGTTAFPKGCMITHRIHINNSLACARCLQLRDGEDRFYDPMPPYHGLGLCYGLIPSILHGCCRIGTEHFDAIEALMIIDGEKCTVTNGFDTMILAWFDHPDFKKYDVSSLRTGLIIAQETALRRLVEEMPYFIPINSYGLSEIGGNFTSSMPEDDLEVRIRFHGVPHEGLSLKIIDPDTGAELPAGQPGEILCGGWTLMKGYYKDPEATASTIDKEGYLHTGDRGFIDGKTGQVLWVGRLKDMLKVSGENVAPVEVENLLLEHPKVSIAQVIGVPDEKYVEVPAAFIELKDGESASEQQMIDFCRGKIASFKIPRYVRFIKEWPMSATKIKKNVLKQQLMHELGQR